MLWVVHSESIIWPGLKETVVRSFLSAWGQSYQGLMTVLGGFCLFFGLIYLENIQFL